VVLRIRIFPARTIFGFEIGPNFGFIEPDRLQFPLHKEAGLIGEMRRDLIEGRAAVLVNTFRRNGAVFVPFNKQHVGVARLTHEVSAVFRGSPDDRVKYVGPSTKAQVDIPAPTNTAPMSFMHEGVQYLVLSVGSGELPGSLVALRLP